MSASAPTSTGLDQNVAGLLSYVLGPFTGVLFFVLEKENRFVRFHAMQSILVGVASFVFWMAYSVLSTILAFIPVLGWLVVAAVGFVASIGLFVLWIVLMVRAYQGQEWELPILGKYARQYSAPAPIG